MDRGQNDSVANLLNLSKTSMHKIQTLKETMQMDNTIRMPKKQTSS